MMNFMKTFLLVLNIISAVFGLISAGVFVLYEIIGAPAVEKLLTMLNIPLGLNQVGWVLCICSVVTIILTFLREKLFRK